MKCLPAVGTIVEHRYRKYSINRIMHMVQNCNSKMYTCAAQDEPQNASHVHINKTCATPQSHEGQSTNAVFGPRFSECCVCLIETKENCGTRILKTRTQKKAHPLEHEWLGSHRIIWQRNENRKGHIAGVAHDPHQKVREIHAVSPVRKFHSIQEE